MDIDEALAGKHLERWGSGWYYCDDEWYIRIGGGNSVLLRASTIDFSKEPLCQTHRLALIKGGSGYHSRLIFTGHGGEKYITSGVKYDDDIDSWVRRQRKRR